MGSWMGWYCLLQMAALTVTSDGRSNVALWP